MLAPITGCMAANRGLCGSWPDLAWSGPHGLHEYQRLTKACALIEIVGNGELWDKLLLYQQVMRFLQLRIINIMFSLDLCAWKLDQTRPAVGKTAMQTCKYAYIGIFEYWFICMNSCLPLSLRR